MYPGLQIHIGGSLSTRVRHLAKKLQSAQPDRAENTEDEYVTMTMYKIHNNLSPSYLRRIFTNTSNVHSHNLRNSELNYYVPRPRTESAKGSLHYRGSVLWNKIPSEIRKLPSLNVFKTSIHGKDFSNTP